MKKIGYCFLFLSLIACKGTSFPNSEARSASNSFEIIYKSNFSGVPQKTYRVIRNKEDFRAFFISMKEDKIPEVNFDISNVLILNMGQKKTGGYDVMPEKMVDDKDKLIVVIKEIYPRKGSMVTMGMTSPVCIAKINSKKNIVLE